MTNIKSFEDACKVLKHDPKKILPVVTGVPKAHRDAIIAHFKLVIIAEALNEGWKPDWNDYDQPKHYPWFNVKASKKSVSGSGLSLYCVIIFCTDSTVGSRLCFRSREVAEYAVKKFKKLYEVYFLLT